MPLISCLCVYCSDNCGAHVSCSTTVDVWPNIKKRNLWPGNIYRLHINKRLGCVWWFWFATGPIWKLLVKSDTLVFGIKPSCRYFDKEWAHFYQLRRYSWILQADIFSSKLLEVYTFSEPKPPSWAFPLIGSGFTFYNLAVKFAFL